MGKIWPNDTIQGLLVILVVEFAVEDLPRTGNMVCFFFGSQLLGCQLVPGGGGMGCDRDDRACHSTKYIVLYMCMCIRRRASVSLATGNTPLTCPKIRKIRKSVYKYLYIYLYKQILN